MIVITVRGMVVQHVISDERNTSVLIIDHDDDTGSGPSVSLEEAEYSPEDVRLSLIDHTNLSPEQIDQMVKPRQ
jgi:hypothetical protein